MKKTLLQLILLLLVAVSAYPQEQMTINMASLDGVALTKQNLLNYQIVSAIDMSKNAEVSGSIRFRNSNMVIGYKFKTVLAPGLNNMATSAVQPTFTYSSGSLKELFELYNKLPEGIYEYCVKVSYPLSGEINAAVQEECIYGKSEDVFLINLIDPENNAKIYEYYPMLSWTVNYPFASALQYKIKVAEIKQGQNTVNAIKRNNPVYEEGNLSQTSINYPVYAKPLLLGQPYAWTVDAYYKDILLGGAEPWRFTIVEDSLLKNVPSNISYYDFMNHIGETKLYAVDTLKLKFVYYSPSDTLQYVIYDSKNSPIKMKSNFYVAKSGTNFWDLDLQDISSFKHNKSYSIAIKTPDQKTFVVPFLYLKSQYLKK